MTNTNKIMPVIITITTQKAATEIQINQEFKIRRFQTLILLIPQFTTLIHIINKININIICKKTLIKFRNSTIGLTTNQTKIVLRSRHKKEKLIQWQPMKIMKSYKALRIFQIVSYIKFQILFSFKFNRKKSNKFWPILLISFICIHSLISNGENNYLDKNIHICLWWGDRDAVFWSNTIGIKNKTHSISIFFWRI